MKKANTSAVDQAITEAAGRRDALGLQMADSPETADSLMPDMIAVCQEIADLQSQRSEIIRNTFFPRKAS